MLPRGLRPRTPSAPGSLAVARSPCLRFAQPLRMPPEQRDLVFTDLGPELGIVDAETFFRCQAQHADLPLVQVLVHRVRSLTDVGEWVHRREDRLDHALRDQTV